MSPFQLKTHPTLRQPLRLRSWRPVVLGWFGVIVATLALVAGCTSRDDAIVATPQVLDEPIEREVVPYPDPYPELNPPLVSTPPVIDAAPPVVTRHETRRLDYVAADEARWNDFVNRWDRPVVTREAPAVASETRVPQANRDRPNVKGTAVIDGNDRGRDGYVEYLKNGNYVAELKRPVGNTAEPLVETHAQTAHPQEVTMRGRVVELEVAAFRDPPQPQLLAVLERHDGQRVLVNLGPDAVVSPLNIHVGQIISVAARVGSINGRRALVAHDIIIDGQSITIAPAAISE